MLKAWIACIAFVVAFAGAQAHAQTPTEEQLTVAREVVLLSGGEAALRKTMDTMRPLLRADLVNRGMSAEQADRYLGLYFDEFEQEMPRILELSALAYANAFSLHQLQEMRAFFGTETGRAMAERLTCQRR